jgi:hypothetical protein
MIELGGWWRASTCGDGACVEVAKFGEDVLVRNSTDPTGPALRISRLRFARFIADVKAGMAVS